MRHSLQGSRWGTINKIAAIAILVVGTLAGYMMSKPAGAMSGDFPHAVESFVTTTTNSDTIHVHSPNGGEATVVSSTVSVDTHTASTEE